MQLTLFQFRTSSALLLAGLGLSSCTAPAGDFCEIVRGPLTFEASTAAAIGATDPEAARAIVLQNSYGGNHCDSVAWQRGASPPPSRPD